MKYLIKIYYKYKPSNLNMFYKSYLKNNERLRLLHDEFDKVLCLCNDNFLLKRLNSFIFKWSDKKCY